MPLFRKSKEEGLKPLSEKDIQERLYGFFHQERTPQISQPVKKTVHRTVDLKSVEVTPAGIIQTELFRSETQTAVEEKKEAVSRQDFRRAVIENEESEVMSNDPDEEQEQTVSQSTASVKKTVKKTARKSKKDKKREEAIRKFSALALEKTIVALKFFFAWTGRLFSALVIWLGESRGESKRVPAKFILISLAVIGTGLIFFNVWSSQIKQNSGAINQTPVNQSVNPILNQGIANQQVITKVVPVSGDVLSRPTAEQVPSAAPAKKFFTIQVCTTPGLQGASNVLKRLQTGGLPAFYESGVNKKGSRVYHVMVGKFDNYQTAKAQLEAIKKSKVMEAYPDSYIRNITEK